MCGIAGSINSRYTLDNRSGLVDKMLASLHHRGPDACGVWSDDYISMGHNRLAIIDLSENGKQPMHRGDWVITYNGEIYNYLEIKKELEEIHNIAFHTQSDTEVILAAWEIWQEKALDKFRGMWAFAIYNKRTYELYLCRDRFGIKPIYYYGQGGSFIFASEIKAILEESAVARRARLTTVVDYLMGFHDHSEATFFEDIYQVEPGQYMYRDLISNTKKIVRYYDLAKAVEGRSATIDNFTDCFEESVLFHLRSDVPVGTCLSGGLDSSSVASIAAQHMKNSYNKQFHAVTAQSEDPSKDESEYARKIVEASDLVWHLVRPSADDFINQWDRCQWFQDEPVGGPSIFMQYCVMQAAKEAGLKVMLDGQGGDEILLGYERYYTTYFLNALKQGKPIKAGKEFWNSAKNSSMSMPMLILYSGYFLLPWLRVLKNRRKWTAIPDEVLEHGLNTLRESSNAFGGIRSLQIAEITKFQLPHLLKYEDRNSMAWSVEARVPFVDHRVIETALALQPEDKIRDGYSKWALRKAMDGRMPESITWRKNKIGFEAPAAKWSSALYGEFERRAFESVILKELNLNSSLNQDNQYLLYNLACWEKTYNVNLS